MINDNIDCNDAKCICCMSKYNGLQRKCLKFILQLERINMNLIFICFEDVDKYEKRSTIKSHKCLKNQFYIQFFKHNNTQY